MKFSASIEIVQWAYFCILPFPCQTWVNYIFTNYN